MGKEVVLEDLQLKFSESKGNESTKKIYESTMKVYESTKKRDINGQPKGKLTYTGLENIPGFNFLSPGSKKMIARSISTTPANERVQKEFEYSKLERIFNDSIHFKPNLKTNDSNFHSVGCDNLQSELGYILSNTQKQTIDQFTDTLDISFTGSFQEKVNNHLLKPPSEGTAVDGYLKKLSSEESLRDKWVDDDQYIGFNQNHSESARESYKYESCYQTNGYEQPPGYLSQQNATPVIKPSDKMYQSNSNKKNGFSPPETNMFSFGRNLKNTEKSQRSGGKPPWKVMKFEPIIDRSLCEKLENISMEVVSEREIWEPRNSVTNVRESDVRVKEREKNCSKNKCVGEMSKKRFGGKDSQDEKLMGRGCTKGDCSVM
jgi:hypothetical protein